MAPAGYGGPLLRPSLFSRSLSLSRAMGGSPTLHFCRCLLRRARVSILYTLAVSIRLSERAVLRPRRVSQRGFQARERRSLGASARGSAKDRSGSGWHGGKRRTRTRWWWRVARRTPLELQLDQLVKVFLEVFWKEACGAAGVPCLWQPWRGRYVLEALTLADAFFAVQASVLANWHW